MATGTYSREPTPPPAAYDEAVEEHLRATQTQVKLIDIVSNTLLLVVGAMGFTLLVAFVDHWILELGFWTRLLALLGLLGGGGWWIAVRIVPLIIKRINPVYAAQTIERAEPSLKNSLINFLLLRNQRENVHAVVYQAVGQRAANDLSHVPVENVVDYSHLLKIGYVLVALLVVGAIYKIVSPKDPFQSAARIVAPWADIDRPAKVKIEDVTPGDVSVFQGEQIEISARIEGAGDGDAHVLFSTLDGQFVDRQVVMQPDESGERYIATIPGDDYGAQTSLQYRIVAGDAQTCWHNVEVVPAPHILVTKVDYAPPRYTKREAHSDARGDIEGLEGTLVTVHARANREIESATLEFDPIPDGVTAEARASANAESRSIRRVDGQNLTTSFYLRRTADGKSPWHTHYTIRFKTADGYRNQKPIVHSIDVKPDVAPLVEILSPKETSVEVPQNRRLPIEVRAVDPDFALTKIRLVAVAGGRDLLDVALLDAASGHDGQVVRSFEFAPAAHVLSVGDEVEYWAVAEDNRRSVKSESPDPNITRSTPIYRIVVARPEPGAEAPMADEPKDESAGGGEESDASSGGSPEENNNGGGEGESGDEDGGEDSENNGGESESSAGGNSDAGGNSGQSGSESSEEGSESSEGNSGSNGESSDSAGGNSGNGNSGGSSQSNNADSSNDQGGNSQQGGQPNGPRDEPIENDGSRDGDIFDAINEHREQQEQGGEGESQSGGNPEDLRDQNLNSNNQNGTADSEESFNRDPAGSASNDSDSTGGAQQNQNDQNNNQSGANSQSGGANGQDGNQNQSGSGENSSGGSADSQDQQNGNKSGEQNAGASGQNQAGNQQSGGSDSQQNQGGASDQQQNQHAGGGESEGGQPQGGAKPEGQDPQGGASGEQQSGGGMGQNDESGGGQESQGGGSPQSQAEDEQQGNKQKSGGGQQGGQQQDQGGKSPAGSTKDSDSQGGSGGDRKGGGEQGGGQSSQQQGQDSAGSSSSGQQGDGAAQEQGAGQSGNRAGGDQIADSPTGNSGQQAGEGSNTGNASGGERNDDQPQQGERNSGDPSSSGSQSGGGSPQDPIAKPPESRGDRVTNNSGDGRGTMPTGGGKPSDNHRSDVPLRDEEPGSDNANLDYARKATDLTLEYLKNQKDAPDPDLLDKLGWTKEDMNQFIERWERAKRSAKNNGEGSDEARRLDDSLRSLGLRPPRGASRVSETGGTRLDNQRDGGSRSRPPKEYAEQYRAFSKFVQPETD